MIREQIIADLAKGKKVLDIGSLGQSDEYCLWNVLASHARELTGVDLPGAVEVATGPLGVSPEGLEHQSDPRIVIDNMETAELGEKYDLVTAGDVIEHVSNPGMFLDNIRRHLRDEGCLVITTPNAKWPTVFLKPNLTHVLWHDFYTLRQLLERHGFRVTYQRYYYGNKRHYVWWKRLLLARQQLFVVAEKKRDA